MPRVLAANREQSRRHAPGPSPLDHGPSLPAGHRQGRKNAQANGIQSPRSVQPSGPLKPLGRREERTAISLGPLALARLASGGPMSQSLERKSRCTKTVAVSDAAKRGKGPKSMVQQKNFPSQRVRHSHCPKLVTLGDANGKPAVRRTKNTQSTLAVAHLCVRIQARTS